MSISGKWLLVGLVGSLLSSNKRDFYTASLCGDFSDLTRHGRRNRGGRGGAIAPPIFCQPKKIKSLEITTYKSVYSNKDKIGF